MQKLTEILISLVIVFVIFAIFYAGIMKEVDRRASESGSVITGEMVSPNCNRCHIAPMCAVECHGFGR